MINLEGIQQNMELYQLKQKDLVEMLGINKSTISTLLSGKRKLTKWHKAAFFFLFDSEKQYNQTLKLRGQLEESGSKEE